MPSDTLSWLNMFFGLLTLACAVLAGVFFSFSGFVMRALDSLDPGMAVRAMIAINRDVLNPGFLGLFFGCALLPALLVLLWPLGMLPADTTTLVLAGAVFALLGFVITVVRNVPLNEQLRRASTAATHLESAWETYCRPWLFWNHMRCMAYLLAAVAFAVVS